jgi:hypothetical protein
MDKKPVNNSRGAPHPQKKAAFGYKIMQVCGYLNARYIASSNQLLAQKR